MLNTTSVRREQVVHSLADKEYRDAFVEAEIDTGLAYQIRGMREARGWSQGDLGERVPGGMHQGVVSKLEDPDYGRHTLSTLKRLASAFDVALVVRFVPFSQLVDWFDELPPERLVVPSFDNDSGLNVSGDATVSTLDDRVQRPWTGGRGSRPTRLPAGSPSRVR